MQDLKPPRGEITIIATCFLVFLFLYLTGYSICHLSDRNNFTALKTFGFAVLVLGACFNPINWLWNFMPWGVGEIVQPPRHARFALPIALIGILFVLWGWVCDGWLIEPPKQPEPTASAQATDSLK
jgi:hypothetical protein